MAVVVGDLSGGALEVNVPEFHEAVVLVVPDVGAVFEVYVVEHDAAAVGAIVAPPPAAQQGIGAGLGVFDQDVAVELVDVFGGVGLGAAVLAEMDHAGVADAVDAYDDALVVADVDDGVVAPLVQIVVGWRLLRASVIQLEGAVVVVALLDVEDVDGAAHVMAYGVTGVVAAAVVDGPIADEHGGRAGRGHGVDLASVAAEGGGGASQG